MNVEVSQAAARPKLAALLLALLAAHCECSDPLRVVPPAGNVDGYVCHPSRAELVRDATVSGVTPLAGVIETTTDAAGYFFLSGLTVGAQTLDVTGSDFVSTLDVQVAAGITTRAPDPSCLVSGTGTVTGRICAVDNGKIGSGEGYYLAGARIRVTVGVDVYETTTDNDGYFTLTGVPAGTQTLLVEKGSFSASAQVDVAAGQVANVDNVCVAPQTDIAVVTGVFDTIEDVLVDMGFAVRECVPQSLCARPPDPRGTITLIDGESTVFITDFLDQLTFLNQFDLVFFNCGLADQYILSAPDSAKNNLRDYVQNGGSIYASDRAYEIVRVVFPGALDFYGNDTNAAYRAPDGWVGVINAAMPASVVDASLATALGVSTVTLAYNKGRWVPLTTIQPAGVYAWLTADVAIDTSVPPNDVADTTWVAAPTLVSAPFGAGRIVFTTFHNSAQVNAEMTAILRFIVFEL